MFEASNRPIIRIWRNPAFAWFMGGSAPFHIMGWMQRVGVGWLTWELTHSPFWLGVIAAADVAPMLILAPIAGSIADNSDGFKILRISQFLLLLHAITLAICTLSGVINVHILLGLCLFNGLVYPFNNTSRQTVLPRIVDNREFATAIALDSAVFQAARFVGPALAAILIPITGVGGTFVAQAMGSVCFQIMLSKIKLAPTVVKQRSRNIFQDIRESVTYVREHGGIAPLFMVLLAGSLIVRPVQDMLPGFSGGVFHAGAQGLAWLSSALGVGAMLSATSIAVRGTVRGLTRHAILGFIGTALSMLGFVATTSLLVGVVFAGLMGFALNTMSTSIQALMQATVDNNMRGRVFALYALIFRGTPALGSFACGMLGELIGLRITVVLGAVVCLIVAGFALPKRHTIASLMEPDDD